MRRLAWLSTLVVMVMVGAALSLADSRAQNGGERVIPLRVMSFRDNSDNDYRVGEACGWSLGTLQFFGADPQLIVRDENDTIVALYTPEGTIERGSTANSAFCRADVELSVPDAEFYTLYLGHLEEIRIMGWSAAEFPLDEVSDYLSIDPEI